MNSKLWKQSELIFLTSYAFVFYLIFIQRSLRLSHGYVERLRGLRTGWLANQLNDLSDSQWRNFRGNLPVLTAVMGAFIIIANVIRYCYGLKGKGMSVLWGLISLIYLSYLHGACIGFILMIAVMNFSIVKIFARSKYCIAILWIFNLATLIVNRVYEGYSFSSFGKHFAFLDNHRGTFRWHICFNLVVLRMISFGCDYHWSFEVRHFDKEKHMQRCHICSSGQTCYLSLQESHVDNYSFNMYLCYLIYAPLYIAGPIISFNAFAKQLDAPQKNYSAGQILSYGLRWVLSFFLMEAMTHFFYYNAFAISGLWRHMAPFEIFIIVYGVLNFMWLKFFLIWRYFRFLSLAGSMSILTWTQLFRESIRDQKYFIGGIESPENMPRCINNCHDLENFWKSWHASFNKWLVRYMYIPLGGSQRKLLNVWVIFTFVAIWHDLEWKLLSWAWLTCIFLVPEILIKSASNIFQARTALGVFINRELRAIAGAITISCLMVANLAGYVVGSSGIQLLITQMLQKDALPALGVIFTSFYVAVKLMFHIRDFKQNSW